MKPFRPRVLAALFSAGAGAAMAIAATAPQPATQVRPQASPQATTRATEAAPAPGEEGPLVPDGPAPDLALIYTGGVVGYVEPCG